MKRIITVISILISFSCSKKSPNTFNLDGEITQDSLNGKEVILLTQVDEISDTLLIKNNNFSFKGIISEPTNAALVINGTMLKFPLVNDQISFVINNLEKKDFEVNYKNSKILDNLNSYFKKEVKDYQNKFKELISLEFQIKSDSLKMHLQAQKDSLSIKFLDKIHDKYLQAKNYEALPIIISDLTGLFGTRNHPQKIEAIFKLLPIELQNGYFGKEITTYLKQSYKIAFGEKVDFKFIDINNQEHRISDYKGKLILLEFWATWCGPCIVQLPSLKNINQSERIEIISVSIDDDKEKWKRKVPELEMNWLNIHFKQDENLKDKFFINGVPYNILLSQEGKILRKNIQVSELIELLK